MELTKQQLKAETTLRFADHQTRADALVGVVQANHPSWPELLRDNWSGCDCFPDLVQVLVERRLLDVRERLMTPEELGVFSALPEAITIYRGCYEGVNEEGFCWSLDAAIARAFPFTARYRRFGTPLLLTATARRESIRFVKLDREEMEVVVPYSEVDNSDREVLSSA